MSEPLIKVDWHGGARPFRAYFPWRGHEVGVCRWTPGSARRRAEQIRDRYIERAAQAEIEDRRWYREHEAEMARLAAVCRELGIQPPPGLS